MDAVSKISDLVAPNHIIPYIIKIMNSIKVIQNISDYTTNEVINDFNLDDKSSCYEAYCYFTCLVDVCKKKGFTRPDGILDD